MSDYMKRILFVIFLVVFSFNVSAKEKDYISIDKKEGIIVIGDLIERINLYSDYVEEGASFLIKKAMTYRHI